MHSGSTSMSGIGLVIYEIDVRIVEIEDANTILLNTTNARVRNDLS